MAKGPPWSDTPPDLFSHATERAPTPLPYNSETVARELPHLLPKNLPDALQRLTDDDLKELLDALNVEMGRRKLASRPQTGPSETPARPKALQQHRAPSTPRTLKASGPLPVTPAKLNAIRAALKAGVKPNTVARQFGLTRAAMK